MTIYSRSTAQLSFSSWRRWSRCYPQAAHAQTRPILCRLNHRCHRVTLLVIQYRSGLAVVTAEGKTLAVSRQKETAGYVIEQALS